MLLLGDGRARLHILSHLRQERRSSCSAQQETQSRPKAMASACPAVPARLLVLVKLSLLQPFLEPEERHQRRPSESLRQPSAGSHTLAYCCIPSCSLFAARCFHTFLRTSVLSLVLP